MEKAEIFNKIRRALNNAPRNGYVAEIHIQAIKHAEALAGVSGKEFCLELGLNTAWGTEYTKMRKIAARLRDAGLDPERL